MIPNVTLIGQRLGNYLIQGSLGYGGMAHVYKGLDLGLKRTVAVKVIEEPVDTKTILTQRFEHEAEAVAQLRHAHIVNVYYFGNQDHLYYLVMEYIDGVNLDVLMHNYEAADELMLPKDVLDILEAIASALDYAHANGVIHRDIKPSNIMIDQAGRPVLTDFGLALSLNKGSIGEIFGTPHYISPEQAMNSANAVPQSDLYSLGVIAFELLAGSVPFTDTSVTALAMQHLSMPVPSPLTFNPYLPKAVEVVLFKALSKSPVDRYQTGAAFIKALRKGFGRSVTKTTVMSTLTVPAYDAIDAPPTRRISMQTALDKVGQEMALRGAKGQALTRMPRMDDPTLVDVVETAEMPAPAGRAKPQRTLAALGGGLLLLGLAALTLIQSADSRTTLTPTAAPTSVINQVALISAEPTLMQLSPMQIVPTATQTVAPPTATQTSVPPSATQTSVPPSATPMIVLTPLEALSVSLEITQEVTEEGIGIRSTPAAENGTPVHFIYNEDGFYWLNDSSRNINARQIVFERVDGGERFPGDQWVYRVLEPGQCMEIRFADVRNSDRLSRCRPNALYTAARTLQTIKFWTGRGQFRVLWRGAEIAVCENAAGECSAVIPRG